MHKKECKVEYFYDDSYDSQVCEVIISPDKIVIEEEHGVIWTGINDGSGHFHLVNENNDTASLHMFTNGKILEGFWIESGEQGMWRIHI